MSTVNENRGAQGSVSAKELPRHTELPFRINTSSSPAQDYEYYRARIKALANVEIADVIRPSHMTIGEADSNAEFIVRACNSHYELLEALEALMPWIAKGIESGAFENCVLPLAAGRAQSQARAAIAKARGEA